MWVIISPPRYILEESNEWSGFEGFALINVMGDELLSSDITSDQALYTIHRKVDWHNS